MIEVGIIGSAKVARTALEDAASIAGLMITTEAMVTDKPKRPNGAAAQSDSVNGMDF